MVRKLLFSLIVILMIALPVQADGGSFPTDAQSGEMLYNEMETVYFTNLARRANGVPPLRMNAELTEAARWFSWDSVENRPSPYCGHQDSQGNWPDARALAAGYLGSAGAENAYCGFLPPQDAVNGWMNSTGHRANILDADHREVGLGYYLRSSDSRGYVTQDFGTDVLYPPVVIDNEAPKTSDRNVDLYIYNAYNAQAGSGYAVPGNTQQIMISNNACFLGADWQGYTPETNWSLDAGTGWQDVYVKSRDALNRTFTASDSIYLGSSIPTGQLTQAGLSSTSNSVTMYQLDETNLPYMQFSLGWIADNTFGTFQKYWGNGEQVTDAAAQGGSAFRMSPGAGETFAWVYSYDFIPQQNFVAYFRLKVNNNTSSAEVARIAVYDNAVVSLKGTDFAAANQYQEFAIPFTSPAAGDALFFKFWRSGSADVFVDAVTIFTPAIPVQDTYTWTVPNGHYRGQGVWLRYTNNAGNFSPFTEAKTTPVFVHTDVSEQIILARPTDGSLSRRFSVQVGCGSELIAIDDATWLDSSAEDGWVNYSVNPRGMALGEYHAVLTLQPAAPEIPAISIPVVLRVVEDYYTISLPLITH